MNQLAAAICTSHCRRRARRERQRHCPPGSGRSQGQERIGANCYIVGRFGGLEVPVSAIEEFVIAETPYRETHTTSGEC